MFGLLLTIARNTFRESVRQPVVLIINCLYPPIFLSSSNEWFRRDGVASMDALLDFGYTVGQQTKSGGEEQVHNGFGSLVWHPKA